MGAFRVTAKRYPCGYVCWDLEEWICNSWCGSWHAISTHTDREDALATLKRLSA